MRHSGSVILFLLIGVFAYLGYNYTIYRTKNAVSDAAFVRSDSLLTLNFKVAGKVIKMAKLEGEEVKKGELLASIDPSDFNLTLLGLQKKLSSLNKKVEALQLKKQTLQKELTIQLKITQNDKLKKNKEIEAFGYEIEASRVKLKKLSKDLKRFKNLLSRNLIQLEKYEEVKSSYESLKKAILAKEVKLKAMRIGVKGLDRKEELLKSRLEGLIRLDKEREALEKEVESLKTKAKEVKRQIEYCFLFSPIDGKVAKKFISVERVVLAGYPIYAVVDPNNLHVEVFLSERKLKGVEVGNRVKIEVDAFPNKVFWGEVERILPASASTFALVPRDISSGEFTKLDQRFIVRVAFKETPKGLRVGMGASVAIERSKE
ncbi:MAG: HlyD family efflux transporter periplasmic adaptor subunit [Epsilonproteobacteria bacterium]|nr:HlyD family efflux transporter periplasmic adaptor subunit [Campylobacterota bacterium]